MSCEPQTYITPPDTFEISPTPPPSDERKTFLRATQLIGIFQRLRKGGDACSGSWLVFPLADGEYEYLLGKLKKDESLCRYVQDKIHCDYEPENNRIILRMPAASHEDVIAKVQDAFESWLRGIREGTGPAANFARLIRRQNSRSLHFSAPTGKVPARRDPDCQWRHRHCKYPGVILEIANTQKHPHLPELAEDYFVRSGLGIKVVIALDVEYKDSQRATLSVWRPKLMRAENGKMGLESELVQYEEFRDHNGNPTNRPGLTLSLSDFANDRVAESIAGDSHTLVISSAELCTFLDESIEEEIERKAMPDEPPPFEFVLKRKHGPDEPEYRSDSQESDKLSPASKT